MDILARIIIVGGITIGGILIMQSIAGLLGWAAGGF